MNDEAKSVPEETKQALSRAVLFADGVTRNFGSKARLLSEETVNEANTGFTVNFYTIKGDTASYTYDAGMVLPLLVLQMAAFGASNKAKASTAGVELDNLLKVIQGKISEFTAGDFVSRAQGGAVPKTSSTSVLTKLQVAWGRSQGLDINVHESIKTIQEYFAGLSADDKKALEKTVPVKRELARITLELATAAYERLNQEV